MEKAKLVVEGAGAVGVAALLSGATDAAEHGRRSSSSAAATSTPGCSRWSRAATRRSRAAGIVVLHARRRTARARSRGLLDCVAEAGANIVEVAHLREGVDLHVRETAVQLMMETRGTRARRAGARRDRAAATG